MNTENITNEPHKFVLDLLQRLEWTCCSSKLLYLLHVEKYKTTAQKQLPQNNSSNIKSWVRVTWWFLFTVRRLY